MVFLVIAAAATTLTVALALNGVTNEPYQRTRQATAGPDVIATSVQAMKAGAVDFLPKPFRADDLLGCVERALIRSAEQRRRSTEENTARSLLGLLTPRELEVMQLVVTGMLNKQIAGELGTAEKTVKVHRGRAMRKLNVTSVAELVRLTEKASLAPAANV